MRNVKLCGVTLALLMVISGLSITSNIFASEQAGVGTASDPGGAKTTNIPYTGLLRTVLYEDHTNSRCSPCVAVEAASVPVLDHYYNASLVAPLYPHMWWPAGNDSIWLYSSVDAFARNQYYDGFNGVPHIRNDGVKIRHHGSDPQVYYSYWNHALGQLTRFSIETYGDLGTETVGCVVEAHEVIEPNPNRMIRFGFWETDIDVVPRFGYKGQYFSTYHWAMWDMLPDAAGEAVFPAGANPGDKVWFNRSFFIDPGQGMIPANLGVSIFIQDDNTKRVEQAAIENFEPADPTPAHELAVYGLEANGDPLHTYEGPYDFEKAGKTIQVNGTVCNYGNSTETNIQVDLIIEGVVEQTQYVTSLDPGYGEMVTFDWTTPTVAGDYDVGVQCEILGGEANTTNNKHEKQITIRLTPEMTSDPAAFTFDVLEGEVAYDNLTLGNVGLADLDHDIRVGQTADVVGHWKFGALSITSYDVGNIYSVATSTTLEEIMFYLSIAGDRELYYVVYESTTTIGGTYNKIHETYVPASGTGERWYSSGPISVPMTAGNFYLIVLKYLGNVIWGYTDLANDPLPEPVSFGLLESGTYGNSIGVPPVASKTNPWTNRGVIHSALITSDNSGGWLSAVPSSGTLPPATQDEVMLTADSGVLAPGTYQTRLLVWNNDPDVWALHVPVTMNVHQLQSMLIPVQEGWNFVSTPLIPQDTALPGVLLDEDGDTTWTTVKHYGLGTWTSWSSFKPPALNDLADVDETMGVWLYVEAGSLGDGFIKVSGLAPTSTTIDLKAGWNMVGYPANDDSIYDVDDLVADTGATEVMGFNPAMPYHIEPLAGTYELTKGEAYWVRVNADTSWVVDW